MRRHWNWWIMGWGEHTHTHTHTHKHLPYMHTHTHVRFCSHIYPICNQRHTDARTPFTTLISNMKTHRNTTKIQTQIHKHKKATCQPATRPQKNSQKNPNRLFSLVANSPVSFLESRQWKTCVGAEREVAQWKDERHAWLKFKQAIQAYLLRPKCGAEIHHVRWGSSCVCEAVVSVILAVRYDRMVRLEITYIFPVDHRI